MHYLRQRRENATARLAVGCGDCFVAYQRNAPAEKPVRFCPISAGFLAEALGEEWAEPGAQNGRAAGERGSGLRARDLRAEAKAPFPERDPALDRNPVSPNAV